MLYPNSPILFVPIARPEHKLHLTYPAPAALVDEHRRQMTRGGIRVAHEQQYVWRGVARATDADVKEHNKVVPHLGALERERLGQVNELCEDVERACMQRRRPLGYLRRGGEVGEFADGEGGLLGIGGGERRAVGVKGSQISPRKMRFINCGRQARGGRTA
jgi:hypothetical protein